MIEEPNKTPEGASPLRSMLDQAHGIEHRSYRTLDEACSVEGVVAVMDGDYGGMIYLTCPVRLIRCDAETLYRLLADIDNLGWNDPEGASLYFEVASREAGIADGMGGGAVCESVWLHPRLMNFFSRVEAVIAGTSESIFIENPEPVVNNNAFQRFLSYVKCGLKSHSPWSQRQKKRKSRIGFRK